jgi:hypothetical protein
MNRNLLLAIAAVVAVGVAAGILFVGNGPSPGPLSGALVPTATSLTLHASNCSVADENGNVSFTLSGELRNATGAGVPGRTVALRTARCDPGGCSVAPAPMDFATTGPDGGFSFVKTEPPTPGYDGKETYYYYRAAFGGDSEYASSASDEARKLC